MQHRGRTAKALQAYHDYLQSDHDFRVWVDVLTIDERFVGTLELMDGQVNVADGAEGPHRTASLTLSDVGGALDFGGGYLRDPKGVLWINRLVQVWHEVTVPGYGDFTTSVMVGLPTAVTRQGAEVGLELGDKSLLADHGVRPRTYKKGMRVDVALRSILSDCVGERHMRIPTTKRRLSRPYTVGMGEDSLTPWEAFRRIAGREMGWRAYYDGRGYAVCESTRATKTPVPVRHVLSLPDASASFAEFSNYSRVTSHRRPVNKKSTKRDESKVIITHESVAVLPRENELSEQSLARNGVPRTLPIVEVNDDLKNLKETNERAAQNLRSNTGLETEKAYEVVPMFHLDPYDRLRLPRAIGVLSMSAGASIPLALGGNMTLGRHKWVSKPVRVRRRRSKTTVRRPKKKGGKKNGD